MCHKTYVKETSSNPTCRLMQETMCHKTCISKFCWLNNWCWDWSNYFLLLMSIDHRNKKLSVLCWIDPTQFMISTESGMVPITVVRFSNPRTKPNLCFIWEKQHRQKHLYDMWNIIKYLSISSKRRKHGETRRQILGNSTLFELLHSCSPHC